jgi:hypothetical protein
MSKRVVATGLALAIALFASASAFAGKGGHGKGADPTLAIATQSPGSVTFSVLIPDPGKAGPPTYQVTDNCYGGMSQLNSTQALPVVWANSTLGYAGTFSPPSGESCFAYAHAPGSDTPAPGGTFSFVAP